MVGGCSKRTVEAVKDMEGRVWRDLCHSGHHFVPLLTKDAVVILFDGKMLSGKELKKYMENQFQTWQTIQIGEMKVVEVDLMAAVVYYDVIATRQEAEGLQTYKLLCSSTWRQEASSDWFCCSHQETWA